MACKICKKSYIPEVNSDSLDPDSKPHVCNICGRGFSLKIQLKRHILSHAGNAPYVCNSCEKSSQNNNQYNLRLTKKGSFMCDVCKTIFNTKRQLVQHSKEHEGENELFCEECGEVFNNHTALKYHSLTHSRKNSSRNNKKDVDMIHECSECGKKFLYYQSYQKHCLNHQKYKCDNCFETFQSQRDLEEHKMNQCNSQIEDFSIDLKNDENVADNKKHVCDICNKSFARKSALSGHLLTHANDECLSDDIAFSSDDSLDTSNNFLEKANKLRLPKLKINRNFPCKNCDIVFGSKIEFDKHILTHENSSSTVIEPELKVDDSDRCPSNSQKVNIELEKQPVQKERKSYTCKVCLEIFKKKSRLKKHMKSHFQGPLNEESSDINLSLYSSMTPKGKPRKSKIHICYLCGKRFAIERCLQKHINKHSGDDTSVPQLKKKGKKPKVLICDFCNEEFTGRRHLFTKHKMSHTPEVCGICDERFVDRASLREHCKIHIGTEEGRVFLECSQKALNAKNGTPTPEPKVEYIYLVLR